MLWCLGVHQHPGHTRQVLGRVGVFRQKILVGVQVDAPVVRHAQWSQEFLDKEAFGAGLFFQQGSLHRQQRVSRPVPVVRGLGPRRSLQDGLGVFDIPVFEQRHFRHDHFPHRPQCAQYGANGLLDGGLGASLIGVLKLATYHGQQSIRLFVHTQQRQWTGRAQIRRDVAAQLIQFGSFQNPEFFFPGCVPQFHQVVPKRAPPKRIHHVQGGALFRQVRIGNVVRGQAVGWQTQCAGDQLQGVFLLWQERVFSVCAGGHAFL